jgi:TonB family protein
MVWACLAVPAVAQESAPSAISPPRTPARVVNVDECKPVYPKESTRAGEVGTTVLRLRVSAEGKLLQADVARSSGFERLDNAVLEALAGCRFAPGTLDGVPRETTTALSFKWRLEEPPKKAISDCLNGIEYPAESLRAEEQGTTVLRVWFNAANEIERAEIAQSSGSPRLDAAALSGLPRCKFKLLGVQPGMAPKEPVRIEYVWRLVDDPPSTPSVPRVPELPDPYRPF